MTTILDALQKGTGYFEKHGVESARLNMQYLLAHVLKCERMQLYVDFDNPIDEPVLEELRALMRDRAQGKPLQHILGTVEFYNQEFLTDERALIPRPETEQLVEILGGMEWPSPARILDVGCGSGVIGLSLAGVLEEQGPEVTLADVSEDALALARENLARMPEGVQELEVTCVPSDLLDGIEGNFDLIVANLPYIGDAEMQELADEVRHDPEQALHGGPRGTEIMERFLRQAPTHLTDGGCVAMEFGTDQAEFLQQMASEVGLQEVRILKDYDEHPRFLLARKG